MIFVDGEKLKNIMDRFPIKPALVLVTLYLAGYDYYFSFLQDSSSPLVQKTNQISQIKQENLKLKEKIKQAEEFQKNLEVKRQELRSLAQELDNMKATLTEGLDVPDFMKMIITEAKKIGLLVQGLKPIGKDNKEHYSEHAFEFSFRGAYVQILAFLDRLSQSQKVIQIDQISIGPQGSQRSKHIELNGTILVKTFSYLGSPVDEIATHRDQSTSGAPFPTGGAR